MSAELEHLKRAYAQAKEDLEEAQEALRLRAIDEFKWKTGDKIQVTSNRGEVKVGRIVGIHFSVIANGEKVYVHLRPLAFPLKKDGTAARIGEFYLYDQDRIVLLERDGKQVTSE